MTEVTQKFDAGVQGEDRAGGAAARMRQFRNWRSGTACIRTRIYGLEEQVLDMSRACSPGREASGEGEEEPRTRGGQALRQDWPVDGGRDFWPRARAMRRPDRRAMVERPGKDLSVRRQCVLLNLARSGVYPPRARHRGGRSGVDAADGRMLCIRLDIGRTPS